MISIVFWWVVLKEKNAWGSRFSQIQVFATKLFCLVILEIHMSEFICKYCNFLSILFFPFSWAPASLPAATSASILPADPAAVQQQQPLSPGWQLHPAASPLLLLLFPLPPGLHPAPRRLHPAQLLTSPAASTTQPAAAGPCTRTRPAALRRGRPRWKLPSRQPAPVGRTLLRSPLPAAVQPTAVRSAAGPQLTAAAVVPGQCSIGGLPPRRPLRRGRGGLPSRTPGLSSGPPAGLPGPRLPAPAAAAAVRHLHPPSPPAAGPSPLLRGAAVPLPSLRVWGGPGGQLPGPLPRAPPAPGRPDGPPLLPAPGGATRPAVRRLRAGARPLLAVPAAVSSPQRWTLLFVWGQVCIRVLLETYYFCPSVSQQILKVIHRATLQSTRAIRLGSFENIWCLLHKIFSVRTDSKNSLFLVIFIWALIRFFILFREVSKGLG